MRYAITVAIALMLFSASLARLPPPQLRNPSCYGSGMNLTGHRFYFKGYYDVSLIRQGALYDFVNSWSVPFWWNVTIAFTIYNPAFDSSLSCKTKFFGESLRYRPCFLRMHEDGWKHTAAFFFNPSHLSLYIAYSWTCPRWKGYKTIKLVRTMDCVKAKSIWRPNTGFIVCGSESFSLRPGTK
ncbi:hypothetical protein CP533_2817 [Ophiocordyceps camponoti-saundersi (nom. inval.)]|nr:hypothetical protein CP533_2817 [Ophiocordyceps camponoti-saundersi (nom. inval.)]